MHSFNSCLIHCVWSTKNREASLTSQLRERLWPYLGGIARENKMKALAVGGTADHIHMLISLPPTMPVAKAVQLLKGNSSKWIHETFPAMGRSNGRPVMARLALAFPISTPRFHTFGTNRIIIACGRFAMSLWPCYASTESITRNGCSIDLILSSLAGLGVSSDLVFPALKRWAIFIRVDGRRACLRTFWNVAKNLHSLGGF